MVPTDLDIEGLADAEPVGSGGNAVVYRAYEADQDRWVAVKVIRGVGDEAELRRFDRERRAMGRLSQHDGIVTIYYSGITGRGEPYLVMPLLENSSLQDRIDSDGPIPWPEAVELMTTVAQTVEAAHQQNVIHRDLKPGNILLSSGGHPLVADFGIARHTGGSASIQSSAITLTPAYSPPETIDGASPTRSADIYGLGATLFALIAGSPPFVTDRDETMLALLMRVSQDSVRDLRPDGVPNHVCRAIEHAMAKAPDDRPTTAAEFATALTPGATISVDPASIPPQPADAPSPSEEQAPPPVSTTDIDSDRPRPRRLLAVVAFLAVLAAGIGTIVYQTGNGNENETTGAPGSLTPTTAEDQAPSAPGSLSTTEPSAPVTTTETTPSEGSLAVPDRIADVLDAVFPGVPFETEIQPAGVAYFGFEEGGDRRDRFSGFLPRGGVEVTSNGVVITTPESASIVTSPFEVSGRGRGFEAVLDVFAVGSDAVVVARTFAIGGSFGTLEPFSVVISTGGYSGPLAVVVSSSTGLESDFPDFALVLVEVIAGSDAETASVIGVDPGDVLNVRVGPSASTPIVDDLPPNAVGVVVISRPDGLTGWWLVRTPSGVEGWANSTFLILDGL